jgi:stress response protein YsnF
MTIRGPGTDLTSSEKPLGGLIVITETLAQDIIGCTAHASDGEKLGSVGQLFLDDTTGRPEFVTVNTGLFGMKESFIPVADATFDGGTLTVPYTKDKVKGAPNVDVDAGHIDQAEEDELYRYYGLGQGTGTEYAGTEYAGTDTGSDTGVATGTGLAGDVAAEGHDTSGPNTDDAMTRSEERVDVGTTSEEAGRARLRKYVTTEMETHTVPVRKERAVVETEPITDANRGEALDGPEISEEEHEVVLREERPVVSKTAEPVERVRLGTETEVEEQTVTEEVRKEHIDVDGDAERR